jgi:hypothetical protein
VIYLLKEQPHDPPTPYPMAAIAIPLDTPPALEAASHYPAGP